MVLSKIFHYFSETINYKQMQHDNQGDQLCPKVQERLLDCGKTFEFTVWAYSPEGIEGEKYSKHVETKPC